MARITRSRRAVGGVDAESAGKTKATRSTATAKVTKEKNAKVRFGSRKNIEQDENAIPSKQVERTSSKKKSQPKATVTKNRKTSGDTVLGLKSPALRDRTNTAVEMANEKTVEVPAKKTSEDKSKVSKTVGKRSAKKTEQKVDEPAPKVVSSDDRRAKEPVSANQLYSATEIEDMLNEDQEMEINAKKVVKGKKTTRGVTLRSKKVDSKETQKSTITSKSGDSKALGKKNMSMEEVEDLLNDDSDVEGKGDKVEDGDSKNKRTAEHTGLSDDEGSDLKAQKLDNNEECHSSEKSEETKKAKKFFKYKHVEEKVEPTAVSKRPRRQGARRKAKAVDDDDSDIDAIMEKNKADEEAVEPAKKNLRRKVSKNYCEISRTSQTSSNSAGAKKTEPDEASGVEKAEKDDKNHLPIYKTVQLSQESIKDKEEIYEFPYDSQDSQERAQKKKKRTAKKPAVKRARKVVNPKPAASRKKLKKPAIELGGKSPQQKVEVQLDRAEAPIEKGNVPIPDDIQPDNEIPENVPNVEEPSTGIKIISNQKLQGSKRINLMTTPSVPKTIASQLKLYGPTNAITSKPTSVYNNMVNHSLIRQSMSPIVKDNNEEIDIGSPWRPVDAFSRVKKVVQSTPQLAKFPINREKKMLKVPLRLSEKSICSADTIHVSSAGNDEATNAEKVEEKTAKNQTSPRKFGTDISNASSMQSKSAENIYEAKTLIQNSKKSLTQADSVQPPADDVDQQSPTKALSPQNSFSECPVDVPEAPAIVDIESTLQSPNKQKKNKFSSPSPFRLERRASLRLASNGKSTPPKLKQANLNAFLKLADMPESTIISTAHGIFDDVPAPTSMKKPSEKPYVEPNIENAFGFDDCDTTDEVPVVEPVPDPKIVTKEDVRKSLKGKIFANARVKSALPARVSTNAVQKTLPKADLEEKKEKQNIEERNKEEEKIEKINEKIDEDSSDSSDVDMAASNKDTNKDTEKVVDPESQKKKMLLDVVSFSDTFDVLSENGDLESKIPEEVPLFVDLEPVHFSNPPRRSYNKRKRDVCFDTSKEEHDDDEQSDDEVKRKKQKHKKKKGELSKEERKRMQNWVKSINETFEEIDNFDLVVE